MLRKDAARQSVWLRNPAPSRLTVATGVGARVLARARRENPLKSVHTF